MPALAGRCSGPLAILGGGRSAWDDYAKLRGSEVTSRWGGEVMAVNDIGAHVHDVVRHWVTLHPGYFPGWRKYREGHCFGHGQLATHHAHKHCDGVDVAWPMDNLGGASGLFACFIGLMLGYSRIVLAGIPMDNAGHYFDPSWQGTDLADSTSRTVWRQANERWFQGRVKSLSGWTRDVLGAPDWLTPGLAAGVGGAAGREAGQP